MPGNLLTVPHIQQHDNADCLAACAAMLLAYVHRPVAYTRLLRILDVKPFGTPARNLFRLSQLGVEITYREGAMTILEEAIGGGHPCIALVRTEFLPYWAYSTDHAVVVVGTDNDSVYLNDPAFTQHPTRVTKLEFELAWLEFDYRYCMLTLLPDNNIA